MKLNLCTNNSTGARLLRLLMWSDNIYIMLPDTDAFKAVYSPITLQGTTNFGHSQDLKASVALATTVEQVNSIVWS